MVDLHWIRILWFEFQHGHFTAYRISLQKAEKELTGEERVTERMRVFNELNIADSSAYSIIYIL